MVVDVQPQPVSEPVRLLHKTHGYTSNPRQALHAEPEAVPADYQLELSGRASRTVDVERRRVFAESRRRMEAELALLRSHGFTREVESDFRVLDRTLERITHRLAS